MSVLLDTNVLLRWFLGDVADQQRRSQELLTESDTASLILDCVIIAELTYVLRGSGYNHKQIAAVIDEIYKFPTVQKPSAYDKVALELYRSTSLDYEDCRLLAIAKRSGSEVATHDKKMHKVADKIEVALNRF